MIGRIHIALVALLALGACREVTTNLVDESDGELGPRDAAPDAPSAGDTGAPAACGDHTCACDDADDDDADGLTDALDPECTGKGDDDEATYATGAPMGSDDCRDCFFDDNAGSGDDDCRYAAACLTGAPAGGGTCSSCEVSDACIDNCLALTPAGCDCFGCCTLEDAAGDRVSVLLTDTCSHQTLSDEQVCLRCVRDTACVKP